MPTANPRTNVTLSPSLDLLVSRLATMQQTSKSQVLRELLEAAEPALQRAVTLMEAASKASANVRENLARSLNHAQDAAESQLAWHLETMQQSEDLVAQAEVIRGRRRVVGSASKAEPSSSPPRSEKRGSTPRPVTRGSGPGKPAKRVPTKGGV